MLYDEPTTGLDPVRAQGINALIRKLQRELGVTSIIVTHDLESARTVGDRVLLLYGGKFIADGTFQDVSTSTDPQVHAFFSGKAETRDSIEAEHHSHVLALSTAKLPSTATPVAQEPPIAEDAGEPAPSDPRTDAS